MPDRDKAFLQIHEYGPWDIEKPHDMRKFAKILLAIAINQKENPPSVPQSGRTPYDTGNIFQTEISEKTPVLSHDLHVMPSTQLGRNEMSPLNHRGESSLDTAMLDMSIDTPEEQK